MAENFLYNSKDLDVISLLVKYYVPLAHFNKVIKLLKFKSAVNLHNEYAPALECGRSGEAVPVQNTSFKRPLTRPFAYVRVSGLFCIDQLTMS